MEIRQKESVRKSMELDLKLLDIYDEILPIVFCPLPEPVTNSKGLKPQPLVLIRTV